MHMPPKCKAHHARLKAKHYQANKADYINRKSKARQQRAELVDSYRTKCKECGFSDKRALEFHHRESKDKRFGISEAIRRCYPVADIVAEIAKCDILCANCHRIHHAIHGWNNKKNTIDKRHQAARREKKNYLRKLEERIATKLAAQNLIDKP